MSKPTDRDEAVTTCEEIDEGIDYEFGDELDDEESLEGIVEELEADGIILVPDSVMNDERLSYKAKALYSYFIHNIKDEDVFPSTANIIADFDISRIEYYKCIVQLLELGYIKAHSLKGQHYNAYALDRITGELV